MLTRLIDQSVLILLIMVKSIQHKILEPYITDILCNHDLFIDRLKLQKRNPYRIFVAVVQEILRLHHNKICLCHFVHDNRDQHPADSWPFWINRIDQPVSGHMHMLAQAVAAVFS